MKMILLLLCAAMILLSMVAGQLLPQEDVHRVTPSEELAHVVEVKQLPSLPSPMVKKMLAITKNTPDIAIMEPVQPAKAEKTNMAMGPEMEKVMDEMREFVVDAVSVPNVNVPEVPKGEQPEMRWLIDTPKLGLPMTSEPITSKAAKLQLAAELQESKMPENSKSQVPETRLAPRQTSAIARVDVPQGAVPKIPEKQKWELPKVERTIISKMQSPNRPPALKCPIPEIPELECAEAIRSCTIDSKTQPPNTPYALKCPIPDLLKLPKVPMAPPVPPKPKMMDPTAAEELKPECQRECTKFELQPVCAFNGDCYHEFPNQCVMESYTCQQPDKGFKATRDDRCLMHWLKQCTEEDLIG